VPSHLPLRRIVISCGAAVRASRSGPALNPSRVDMSPQQPLERRWVGHRSSLVDTAWSDFEAPSRVPDPMAGPQRRLQASGVAHPQRPERNRPSFGRDWVSNAARTDQQDRAESQYGAGRQFPTGRRSRMLPRQSALVLQPCKKAAGTARRISSRTTDARALSCEPRPCSVAARQKPLLRGGSPHPRLHTRDRNRRNSRGRNP
jgi:hypothetical protein